MIASLTRAQRDTLLRLLLKTRAYEANDSTNLNFERLGYIERIGTPRQHRLASHMVIEWAITDAGRAMVAQGAASEGSIA